MRRATTRPGCVLTRYGCVRLAWDFEDGHSSHPALELVDAVRVLRAEDVQVDWYDLSDRLGLHATPSNKQNSAAERRASRFFTNVFYPWTSRELQQKLWVIQRLRWCHGSAEHMAPRVSADCCVCSSLCLVMSWSVCVDSIEPLS